VLPVYAVAALVDLAAGGPTGWPLDGGLAATRGSRRTCWRYAQLGVDARRSVDAPVRVDLADTRGQPLVLERRRRRRATLPA
jgi:hypothetical protein